LAVLFPLFIWPWVFFPLITADPAPHGALTPRKSSVDCGRFLFPSFRFSFVPPPSLFLDPREKKVNSSSPLRIDFDTFLFRGFPNTPLSSPLRSVLTTPRFHPLGVGSFRRFFSFWREVLTSCVDSHSGLVVAPLYSWFPPPPHTFEAKVAFSVSWRMHLKKYSLG